MGLRCFPAFFKKLPKVHANLYCEEFRVEYSAHEPFKRLHVKEPLILMDQVHGAAVRVLDFSVQKNQETIAKTDGVITDRSDLTLGVYTADCIGALCVDPKNHVIAAFHAGYQGILSDIAGKVVREMNLRYGTRYQDIVIQTAPMIQSCCYEVTHAKDNRVRAFISQFGENVVLKERSRVLLDLRKAFILQLREHGIDPAGMNISNECTVCSANRYPSHYRSAFIDKKKTRECSLLSTIGLADEF